MTLLVMPRHLTSQIKPLPEVLPGLGHDVNEDQQLLCAQPASIPEGLAVPGSMQTGQASEEAAQKQVEPQSAEQELQVRKQRLLETLDILGSHPTGSVLPAAVPAASQSAQNGHGHVHQEEGLEDEVPPPPLGSPRASQATAVANTGTIPKAGLHETASDAASGGHHKFPSHTAAQDQERPPAAYPAASEGAGVHLHIHFYCRLSVGVPHANNFAVA